VTGEKATTTATAGRSARVEVVAPRADWNRRAGSLIDAIEAAALSRVVRIDHIGSTSVPGLPAKDVVDIQVVVTALEPRQELADAVMSTGLRAPFGLDGAADHVPPAWTGDDAEWRKLFFSGEHDGGRCNVHVRVTGRANARYALLFRDYLRATPAARDAWGVFKIRLAEIADDIDAYVEVKDAATDVLMLAAERWAAETAWVPAS
jgi:GrpB-like predicted nucleotidyltransferase (UPF0157 family)